MAAVGGASSARRRLVLGRIARGPAPSRSCTLTSSTSTGCDNLEEESGGSPVRGATGTKRLGTGPASGSRHWKTTTSQGRGREPGLAGGRLRKDDALRACVKPPLVPLQERGGGVASSRWGRGGITAPAGVYCVREPGEGLGPSRPPPPPRVASRYFPTNTVTFGGPEPARRSLQELLLVGRVRERTCLRATPTAGSTRQPEEGT